MSGLALYARPASAAIYGRDTFTDTDTTELSTHTSTGGAAWAKNTGGSADMTILGNRCVQTTSNGGLGYNYYLDVAPASPNYRVQADFVVFTVISTNYIGLGVRKSTTAATHYEFTYNGPMAQWELNHFAAGSGTLLDSAAVTLTNGQTYRVALEAKGSLLRGKVNGLVVVEATDANITTAGRAGLGGYVPGSAATASTGIHVDNFVIQSLGCNPLLLEGC